MLIPLLCSNRTSAEAEIKELLQEFRDKRALGLGSLFGDHQLEGTTWSQVQVLLLNFFAVILRDMTCKNSCMSNYTVYSEYIIISITADDNMEKGKELQVVEQTLMPHLDGVL